MPSGRIEDGETPAAAAARELAEESGCLVDPDDLQLFAITEVRHQSATISTSWNFTAATTQTQIGPVVPDVLVTDARWFERADAIDLLSRSSYAPKREPFLRFLQSGESGLQWSFELVDPTADTPTFVWDPPT
jgi:8-oxo-dGTP pyrophosphatase MutT (NUDIX family)